MNGADDFGNELEALASGGWDDLGQGQKRLREARDRVLRDEAEAEAAHARVVRDALDTPAGARLMAWLRSQTIEREESGNEVPGLSVEAYALAMARRQGQDSIVRRLAQYLADAKPKPKTEQPTAEDDDPDVLLLDAQPKESDA